MSNEKMDLYTAPEKINKHGRDEAKKKSQKKIRKIFRFLIIAVMLIVAVVVNIPKSHDVIGENGEVIGVSTGRGFGVLDGKRTVTLTDGTKIKGKFKNGGIISDAKYTVSFVDCGTYVGQIDDDFHPHGNGVYTNADGLEIESDRWNWSETANYTGMLKERNRCGFGRVIDKNGVYEGEFLNDDYFGRLTFTDTERTISITMNCVDGKVNGDVTAKYLFDDTIPPVTGERKTLNGVSMSNDFSVLPSKFSGFFVNDTPVYGILRVYMGDKYCEYKGTFINGIASGRGVFTYSDGSSIVLDQNYSYEEGKKHSGYTYTGMIVDGKEKGFGIFEYSEDVYYAGELGNDSNINYGVETYQSGDKYVGQFNNNSNSRNGYGVYTFTNGNTYEGNWEDEKYCGYGKFTRTNGDIYEGEWEDNKLISGKITYANGDIYEGELTDWKPDGEGAMKFAALGTSYEGNFVNGIISGYGIYHSKLRGDISGVWSYVYDRSIGTYWSYTGMMKDGVLCGCGVIEDTNPDNLRTIYGEFLNDQLDGYVNVIQDDGYNYQREVSDGDFKEIYTRYIEKYVYK